MSVFSYINDRVTSAANKARENKKTMTKEESTQKFFTEMADLFNETVAGEVTLVDGRTTTIKSIPTFEI